MAARESIAAPSPASDAAPTHKHQSTLGRAELDFADARDVERFIETLARFERGELSGDEWRAFRLVNGTYGQKQEGESSMLRVKIPQGILRADQLERIADVSRKYGRGFVHLTTRQNIQYHFLRLSQMGAVLTELADAGLTTKEACGNAVRNVTTSTSAGVAADEKFDPVPYAEALTRYFLRHRLSSTLPRKFKIAFNGGGADHSFAAINDLGFHGRIDAEGRRGFRITVAGGTAILCRTGHVLAEFCAANDILAYTEAVLRVFDALGDRVHRHKNRLKFLVKNLGWETFYGKVIEQLEQVRAEGAPSLPFDPERPPTREHPPETRAPALTRFDVLAFIADDGTQGPGIHPRPLPVLGDPRGERFIRSNVRPQKQAGYSTVTVTLPLGDATAGRLRAIAALSRSYGDGKVRLTTAQNLVLHWVRDEDVRVLYEHLTTIGLAEPDADTIADVGSCPGAESCKLAVTQSRGAAQLLGEALRADRSLVDRTPGLTIRISGCPNGCGLHHVAGIGLQGGLRKVGDRAAPQYFVYAGALVGDDARFGKVVAKVPARRVVDAVRTLIETFEKNALPGERADEYFARAALSELKAPLAHLEPLDAASATEQDFIDLGETTAFRPETSEGECAA
ncbi:MAG: nitrite/sulfite reductase [Polyangiales bacterium]